MGPRSRRRKTRSMRRTGEEKDDDKPASEEKDKETVKIIT